MPLHFDAKKLREKTNPLLKELGIHTDEFRFDYEDMSRHFIDLVRTNKLDQFYEELGTMALQDLWTFSYFILDLPVDDPFVMARIYNAEDRHHMVLDLWAREHFKSTILSYALPLWRTIKNPENRVVFFCYNSTLARKLIGRVKNTIENNTTLTSCFPWVFYENPEVQSPKWSERDGLVIKRRGVYNEASFEGYGLIDKMPTGGHYSERIYDDIVDPNTVSTAEAISKAEERFKLSDNLGSRGGIKRVVGTRYKYNDPYERLIENGRWITRSFPAEVDEYGEAKREGIPVFMDEQELNDKFDDQGEYHYYCQMLQRPRVGKNNNFRSSYKKTYDRLPKGHLNYYIVVDSAKRKKSFAAGDNRIDYTVMWAFCVDSNRNWYMLDGVRDRLDLEQKWIKLRELSQKWNIARIGYEQYGMATDAEYMDIRQKDEGLFLDIIELGGLHKDSRILQLIPYYKNRKILWPDRGILYEDTEGNVVNLVDVFFDEEFYDWPSSGHDDMFDCHSRMLDPKLEVVFPEFSIEERPKERYISDPLETKNDNHVNETIDWLLM